MEHSRLTSAYLQARGRSASVAWNSVAPYGGSTQRQVVKLFKDQLMAAAVGRGHVIVQTFFRPE